MPDGAAFDAFFRENFARIVRASALVTLDVSLAEDIAAEAFARLWGKWGQIDDDDHAGGFVFKTAMRLCARERSRRRRTFRRAPSPEGQDPDRAFLAPELVQALKDLPMRQRQCVVLRDWAGYQTAEVARLLGAKESTVRVHLMRGRARLREALRVDEGSHS